MRKHGNPDLSVWRSWGPGQGFAFAEEMEGLSLRKYGTILEGRKLRPPLPTIVYGGFSGGPLPEALAAPGGMLIATKELRALLESESHARIQFVPVRLRSSRRSYALANILERVDCFDRERSSYRADAEAGGVSKLRHLVLTGVPKEGPEVFHLEGIEGVILFRPKLRRLFEERFPSAGHFVPVSKFKIGYL